MEGDRFGPVEPRWNRQAREQLGLMLEGQEVQERCPPGMVHALHHFSKSAFAKAADDFI